MKKTLIALLVALSLSAPASADTLFNVGMVFAVTGHGMDLSITSYCLGAETCKEANPLLRPIAERPILLGAAKMGLAGASLWYLAEAHKSNPKVATVVVYAMGGLFTYIAIRNGRTIGYFQKVGF